MKSHFSGPLIPYLKKNCLKAFSREGVCHLDTNQDASKLYISIIFQCIFKLTYNYQAHQSLIKQD